METIIQIEAMQTEIVDTPSGSKDIRGILWGLGERGTLYKLGDDNKWEVVCERPY